MDAAGFMSVRRFRRGVGNKFDAARGVHGVCLRAARGVESWTCPARFIDKRDGGAAGGAPACSWPPALGAQLLLPRLQTALSSEPGLQAAVTGERSSLLLAF